ncbi:MAG: hypothetical protein ACKPKO_03140, partial [Candidatus Fonsibacter sp.]
MYARYGGEHWRGWSTRDGTCYWSFGIEHTIHVADGGARCVPIRGSCGVPAIELEEGMMVFFPANFASVWEIHGRIAVLWMHGHAFIDFLGGRRVSFTPSLRGSAT